MSRLEDTLIMIVISVLGGIVGSMIQRAVSQWLKRRRIERGEL